MSHAGKPITEDQYHTWNDTDGGGDDSHPYNPHCNCDPCTNKWWNKEADRQDKFREVIAKRIANPDHDANDPKVRQSLAEMEQIQAEIDAEAKERFQKQKLFDLANEIQAHVRTRLPSADIESRLSRYLEEARESQRKAGPKFMHDRIDEFKGLREPVIAGLLRQGEVMNLVSETKVGKSWLALNLALSVATEGIWLQKFATKKVPVLYLDNELHEEDSTWRTMKVAEAMHIDRADYAAQLAVENFRGRQIDVDKLGSYFTQFRPGEFGVVVFDAGYRFQRMEADENSNGHMTAFYNTLDHYAAALGAAFVIVHHSTKGTQGGKRLTDVGAGAGAQSRAPDTHCVLRAHQDDDVFVMDAACRTWPKIQPVCLRWSWPLWTAAFDLDPSQLRTDKPPRKAKVELDGIEKQQPWTAERFAREFASAEPQPKAAIIDNAIEGGMSAKKVSDLISRAIAKKLLHRWPTDDKRVHNYATVKPSEAVKEVAE